MSLGVLGTHNKAKMFYGPNNSIQLMIMKMKIIISCTFKNSTNDNVRWQV